MRNCKLKSGSSFAGHPVSDPIVAPIFKIFAIPFNEQERAKQEIRRCDKQKDYVITGGRKVSKLGSKGHCNSIDSIFLNLQR